jgi:hypothetical protein
MNATAHPATIPAPAPTNGHSAEPWFSAQECAKRAQTSVRRIARFANHGAVARKRSADDTKWLYNLDQLRDAIARSDSGGMLRANDNADDWRSAVLVQATQLLHTSQVQQREMYDRGVAYERELRAAYADEVKSLRARVSELETRELEVARQRVELMDEATAREIARDVAMRKQAMWERAVENVSKSGPELLMGVLQTFAPANDNRARSALELYELQRKQSAGTELTEAERARVDVLLQELG